VKTHNLRGALKRSVFIGILLIVVCPGIIAYEENGQLKLFTVEELQSDFRQVQGLMEKGHSILCKFTDRPAFDRFVKDQFAKIDKPMSLIEFYRILSPVLSRIGCGHSSLWLPKGYWKNASAKLMPLRLVFLDGKAYVWRFYKKVEGIPEGIEILSINGKPIPETSTL